MCGPRLADVCRHTRACMQERRHTRACMQERGRPESCTTVARVCLQFPCHASVPTVCTQELGMHESCESLHASAWGARDLRGRAGQSMGCSRLERVGMPKHGWHKRRERGQHTSYCRGFEMCVCPFQRHLCTYGLPARTWADTMKGGSPRSVCLPQHQDRYLIMSPGHSCTSPACMSEHRTLRECAGRTRCSFHGSTRTCIRVRTLVRNGLPPRPSCSDVAL